MIPYLSYSHCSSDLPYLLLGVRGKGGPIALLSYISKSRSMLADLLLLLALPFSCANTIHRQIIVQNSVWMTTTTTTISTTTQRSAQWRELFGECERSTKLRMTTTTATTTTTTTTITTCGCAIDLAIAYFRDEM